MRNGILGSLTAMLTAAGLAMAQAPAPSATPSAAEPKPETTSQLPAPLLAPDSGPGLPLWCEPLPPASDRFYSSGEYLLWFAKGARLPPLATANNGPSVTVQRSNATLQTTAIMNGAITTIKATNVNEAQSQGSSPILGTPNTFVVIGNVDVDDEARSGALLTAGFWLDPEETIGIECSGFLLEPHASHFSVNSNEVANLAQPFINPSNNLLVLQSTRTATFPIMLGTITVLPATLPPPALPRAVPGLKPGAGFEDAFLIGTTQTLTGSQTLNITVVPPRPPLTAKVFTQASFAQTNFGQIDVSTASHFGGAEADVRINAGRNCNYRVDLLGGFRFLELKDQLHISSMSSLISTDNFSFNGTSRGVPVSGGFSVVKEGAFFQGNFVSDQGGVLNLSDTFNTRNQFYGGQFGAEAEFLLGRWAVNLRGKLGLGVMHQVADIFGTADVVLPTGQSAFAGGLYAQASNSGIHSRDVFGVVPEAGIQVGYQVTRHVRATVGYSGLIALGCVLRPGDQLDRTLNPNLIPALYNPAAPNPFGPGVIGPARPAFVFKDTDYWAQGLNAGLEFDF
jgi:hypothetical protein